MDNLLHFNGEVRLRDSQMHDHWINEWIFLSMLPRTTAQVVKTTAKKLKELLFSPNVSLFLDSVCLSPHRGRIAGCLILALC